MTSPSKQIDGVYVEDSNVGDLNACIGKDWLCQTNPGGLLEAERVNAMLKLSLRLELRQMPS